MFDIRMVWHGIINIISYRIMNRLPTLIQLFIIFSLVQVTLSVESITTREQLLLCLTTCNDEVTDCVKIQNQKCTKSYHTCLHNSRDFYRCFNSSKIQELIKLTTCIREKCPLAKQVPYDKTQNYHYNQHRTLPTCGPWIKSDNKFQTQVMGEAEKYKKCKYFKCKLSKTILKQNQNKASKSNQNPSQDTQPQYYNCGKQYGRGRSSVAILSGLCAKKN